MRNIHSSNKLALLASTILLSGSLAVQAAEDKLMLDEIVVTAQKRESNLQDVSLSVQVLGNQQLEDLNVNAFDDYIQFLPTVSFQTTRPGYAQIYMRGISSGGDGNHSGSMPSVGVYLDEQPITTINQILDLHIYDIARIETLSGPQGSLFGASSQAGTMRIITNQPVLGEYEGGFDVAMNTVKNGEMGYTVEGFANLPVADNAAIRLVAWHEKDGGYIDNVYDEITYVVPGITKNNASLVEKNFNDATTTGMRGLLKVDLNENWTVTPGITYQHQKTQGSFDHDPERMGDLKATEFFPTKYEEDWYQATLTVNGNIGGLDVIYAGAYLNRNVDGTYDYSGYAEYLANYGCYYTDSDDNCLDPSQYLTGDEKFTRQSHELRLQTPQDKRLRAIAGVFYQRQKHDFDFQWNVPAMESSQSVVENDHVVWQTKQVRIDRDLAAFGEVSFDLTDKLTLLGGVRFYKYRNTLYGFNGSLSRCTGSYVGGVFVQDSAGTPQYPCFDTRILDDEKEKSGQTFKFNLSYQIDDDKMVYATFSQGFRPGGVNRATVANVPSYDEDFVDNYEIGWKTTWLDNRLRFNGSIYYVDWSDVQLGVLNFAISPLTIIHNAGNSRTYGAEFDLVFAATDNLTLSLAASYNDAKLTEDFGSVDEDGNISVLATKGTEMPFVPQVQFTAIARYEEEIAGMPAFFQGAFSYTDDSWSSLILSVRQKQHKYALLNLSAGISKDNWTVSIFADNVTDKRAEILHIDPGYFSERDTTTTVNRPRTIGVRFGQRF